MTVDLPLLAVLGEQSAEDALPAHPEDLGRHARLRRTLAKQGFSGALRYQCDAPLAGAGVTAGRLGLAELAAALARVRDVGLFPDDPIRAFSAQMESSWTHP